MLLWRAVISSKQNKVAYSCYCHEDINRSCSDCHILNMFILHSCWAIDAVSIVINLKMGLMLRFSQAKLIWNICLLKRNVLKIISCVLFQIGAYGIDSWQLLAHVHEDYRQQLPAQWAEGEEVEQRESTFCLLWLNLNTHLTQLLIHILPAPQPLQA